MKTVRIITIIAFIAFTVGCLAVAADYKYVGSSKSNKYHYPTCEWAAKINPKNLGTFKSAKEALDAGYLLCKVCRPPIKD